jgi:hypothetical protein
VKVGRDYTWWVSYSWTYEWFEEESGEWISDRDFEERVILRVKIDICKKILSFLDTLEVKEVYLDLGNPDGDMGVKTVWDGDKIVSIKAQKGG